MRAHSVAISVLAVLTVAACARTRANQSKTPVLDVDAAPSPGMPGGFAAEVAAVDPRSARITLRHPSASDAGVVGGERTVPVTPDLTPALGMLQSGDQVVVACDDGAGNAVTSGAGGPSGPAPSARAGTNRRDYGPAGGGIGIGATDGTGLRDCPRVSSLMRIAQARR